MKRTTQKPVDVVLPDSARDALHAAAEQGRLRWQVASAIALGILSDAHAEGVTVRKGDVYRAVAAEIDAAANTVAQWCNVYEVVENSIEQYCFFSFDHWRAIMALSKKKNTTIEEEAELWAASAEDFGGRVVPVDKLRAALSDPDAAQTLDAPKSAKTLGRLGRAVAAHDKALGVGDAGVQAGQREAWAVVRAAVEDYVGKYGPQEEDTQ